jgi:hypothetical protein
MIRVSELSGAWLDYWVARAEGVPADQLEVRQIQRSEDFHCVRTVEVMPLGAAPFKVAAEVLRYSTDWRQCGPLLEKWCTQDNAQFDGVLYSANSWSAPYLIYGGVDHDGGEGATPQEAICRAVVRAAFGEEVPEVTP